MNTPTFPQVRYRRLIGKLFWRIQGERMPGDLWRLRWGMPSIYGIFERVTFL